MAKQIAHETQLITKGLLPVHRVVQEDFRAAIAKAFPDLDVASMKVIISASQPQFGDYQCNNAMALFKQYGKTWEGIKSPKDIGEKIAAAVDRTHYMSVATAPAGFVTVKLSSDWLSRMAEEQILNAEKIMCQVDKPGEVGIDFSSPNIAKEMHVGHLRSTIHGESLSRVLSYVGHTVHKVNHLGDWGTQFGMLIEFMREEYPQITKAMNGETIDMPNLGDLNVFYKKAKARFDADEDFKTRARQMVVTLQSGDPAALAAWKLLISISLQEFDKVYARLGIKDLEAKGESFYNDLIPPTVKRVEEAGLIEVVEGGAKCVFQNPPEKRKNEVPLMLVKSDGGYGYDSTDAAAVYHRLVEQKMNWFIYVTDIGQEEHFMKVFNLAERMGWHTPPKTRLDHCGLGLVCGDDGKKFKTRSGEVVKLIDLLDEAVSRAEEEIKSRRDYTNAEELRSSAEKIGYAACRYFDMNQVRTGNYVFSYSKMLDPKGNTAVYLFYAYARVCSLFRKSDVVDESSLKHLSITEECERKLLTQILKLPDVLETILDDMSMHRMCSYAYDICVLFSEFYQQCRIADNIDRLALCLVVKKSLAVAFHLLGMEPLEQI